MPKVHIDAIGVTATDMARTVAFYELLGFEFDGADLEAQHVEPKTEPGQPRLMIDHHDLATKLIGEPPRPSNHAHFALLMDSAAEVDAVAEKVERAGFALLKAPWDAFWGQRYAVIADPDGYQIDLFAPL
ncbi:VOC family protein [Palleronia caenipelagi]|uniref:Glyoxalase n=1 Tax=Palleronia caenipelagi TaxID=2489174 RepID=A0A547QAU4_9RHOB|nr:VOC family protein [Palleronia caenipelagi]TRD23507.1 glyoxalase [Palleronia caenipelagi]